MTKDEHASGPDSNTGIELRLTYMCVHTKAFEKFFQIGSLDLQLC